MSTTSDHDRDHAFAELLAAGRAEHGRIYPLKRDVAAFEPVRQRVEPGSPRRSDAGPFGGASDRIDERPQFGR